MLLLAAALVMGTFPGTGVIKAMAGEMHPGWNQSRNLWYWAGEITGEGTIKDYLASVHYREHASCLELYIRNCGDEGDAWSKVEEKTVGRYDARGDRKYSLEYYRELGMAHGVKDGKNYFMIVFMR